jgi:hypothetical protein
MEVPDVAYGGGTWVAVVPAHQGGEPNPGASWVSSDGKTWEQLPYAPDNYSKVAYGGGKFLILGNTFDETSSTPPRTVFVSSTDGHRWTRIVPTGLPQSADFSSTVSTTTIAYGDGRWVATSNRCSGAAGSGDGCVTSLYASRNGTSWSKIGPDFGGTPGIAFGGGTWLVTGVGASQPLSLQARISVSRDLTTWSTITLPAQTLGTADTRSLVAGYGGGRWRLAVAPSLQTGVSSVGFTSRDARSWTNDTMPSGITWMLTFGGTS